MLLAKLRLTERDYEIMRDLYSLRALTVAQIAALHFPGVTSGDLQAARKRLRRLALAGYLYPRRWMVRDGRYWKIAGIVYMLADPGMHAVCDRFGLKHRKAEDNAVESWRFELHLLAAQVAVEARLGNIPWQWLEAREAKNKYGIPYGSPLSGMLLGKSSHGSPKVGVYAIP
ncbi:MAG: replication-relaxation family protein, partial [Firmicutes bacterium]|nr:replication-relaxation family protein [Bacillota bacterium]